MAIIDIASFQNTQLKTAANIIGQNAKAIHKDRFLYSFTDHGYEHSERMIVFCNILLKNNNQRKLLNQYEKFVLISAIYLHDIGIQLTKRTHIEAFISAYNLDCPNYSDMNNLADFIRKHHHLISGYWVRQNVEKNSAFTDAYYGDDTLGQIVALVIESHGLSFGDIDIYNSEFDYKGESIRIKLLSALLCLADVFDCDCRRIDTDKFFYTELPQLSRLHWYKHYYVSSVKFNKKSIYIQYRFPNTLDDYEKSVYLQYFSYHTRYWINQLKQEFIQVFRESELSFDVEEYVTPLANQLFCLSENDFCFIEEECVNIIENGMALMVVPKKVVIGIMKYNNQILMVERRIVESGLSWQFPAGTLKPGFSEEKTITKEIFEETGLTCRAVRRLGRRVHPDTNVICCYWIIEYLGGTIINGDEDENKNVCWVSTKEYHKLISTNLYKPIKQYIEEDI